MERLKDLWARLIRRKKATPDPSSLLELLKLRDKQFEIVANALPALVSYIGSDFRYQYANANYKRWLNIDAVVGRTVEEVCGPNVYPQLLPHMHRVLTGENVSFEFDLPFRDGLHRMRSEYFPHFSDDGRVLGFVVLARDVSDDVKREQGLKETAERLRLAMETAGMGSWMRDVNSQNLEWSDSAYDIFGIPRGTAMNVESLLTFIHPDDQARWIGRVRDFSTHGDIPFAEYRILRNDGTVRWIHSRVVRVLDAEQKVQRLLGVMRDITDHKLAEESMRISESHFRQLADTMPALVWTATAEGTVNYFNHRWYDYTGIRGLENWQDVIHLDDRNSALTQWEGALRKGEPITTEFRMRSNEGYPRWHLVRAVPVKDADGKVLQWYGTCTDIDDHKKIESELSKAKESAEAANRLKSAFLANMSHEIRTPLGAVLGFSELLVSEEQTQEEKQKCLDAIKRNGEIVSTLISDILDLSKIEAGKLEIEKIEVPTREVISDLHSLLYLQAQEKGLDLRIECQDNIPQTIVTDPLRLRQILINIVGNAVKFTSRGSVSVRIEMRMNAIQEQQLAFIVSDTGPGIGGEQAERLFEPFMQADASSTRKYGGTGLGLALSRRLAKALGGNVILEGSAPGRGSTFSITINPGQVMPAIAREDSKKTQENMQRAKDIRLDGFSILLVEDAPDNRMLVGRVLALAGASVDMATNGKEGVLKAETHDYDLVIMDLQMPEMDGHEATITLRQCGYVRPIIALTAHALKDERQRCLNNGFSDYLSKPIDRSLLLGTLKRHGEPYRQTDLKDSGTKATAWVELS